MANKWLEKMRLESSQSLDHQNTFVGFVSSKASANFDPKTRHLGTDKADKSTFVSNVGSKVVGFQGKNPIRPVTDKTDESIPTNDSVNPSVGIVGSSQSSISDLKPRHLTTDKTDRSNHSKKQSIKTLADLMAIQTRPCVLCGQYSFLSGYCDQYQKRLPEPTRECRCVHYRPRCR